MDQKSLFPAGSQPEAEATKALPPRLGPKRLRSAVRNQIEFQQCAWTICWPKTIKRGSSGATLTALIWRSCSNGFKPSRQDPARPANPAEPLLYATCVGGQCTGTEPLVSVSRGLSLDLRRGVDELSYALRHTHGARRTDGPPADG